MDTEEEMWFDDTILSSYSYIWSLLRDDVWLVSDKVKRRPIAMANLKSFMARRDETRKG